MNWFKSAYVHERHPRKDHGSAASGTQLLDEWCKRTGLTDEWLQKRLTEAGLNISQFRTILAERDTPFLSSDLEWTRRFDEIMSMDEEWAAPLPGLNPRLFADQPFYPFVMPFLRWTQHKLRHFFSQNDRLCRVAHTPVMEDVVKSACRSLLNTAARTLVYELHECRDANRLSGETPEARFDSYEKQFLSDGAYSCSILEKYPVLCRLLTEDTSHFLDAQLEFLQRLLADYTELEQYFAIAPGTLIHLKTNAGDRHCNGRSVILAEFESGTTLVYKPRSLSIDQHFQDFLIWLNDRGAQPAFRTLRMLSKESYGWQEFVRTAECTTEEQISRFYRRQGGYLAIFYLLNGSDMHFENVLAAGEHPMMIDLEALFSKGGSRPATRTAYQKASEEFFDSVLKTGLLPGGFSPLDMSGIGGKAGQEMSEHHFEYEHTRTDQMKLVRKTFVFRGGDNLPVYNGEKVQAEAYVEDIVLGFTDVYQLLLNNRNALASPSGPIHAFARDTLRVVLRDTMSYGTMLNASLHPSNLMDGLNREQLFDFMWRIVAFHPAMIDIVASERVDLLRGDVPIFRTEVNSRHVWDSNGKVIEHFYSHSGLDTVMTLLTRLSPEDCTKQCAMIRASMLTLETWITKEKNLVKHKQAVTDRTATKEKFLRAAERIGNHLAERAIWGDQQDDVAWASLSMGIDGKWKFALTDHSLYKGTLGMTLFYAQLARQTGQEKFSVLAKAALQASESFLAYTSFFQDCSAFLGYPAYCYVYVHLGLLWQYQSVLDKAIELLDKVEPLIERDQHHDWMLGTPGTLSICLKLYHVTKAEKALELAKRCGEHLLSTSEPGSVGIGWKIRTASSLAVSGFSHGLTGIALALAQLSSATGDPRYREAAMQALTLERTLYDPADRNWQSGLTEKDSMSEKPIHWCSGSAGIALGRALLLNHVAAEELEADLHLALQTTLEKGFDRGHCLCHGDMGNLDILLVIAQELNDPQLKEWALQFASKLAGISYEEENMLQIPHSIEIVGLMDGLAGIGYGFLRLADPVHVPSILALEIPPAVSQEGVNIHANKVAGPLY
ncbi:MAG: type 2 lanthipeptide synthetase LanM family protein [Clostridia bacterium]